MRRCRSTVSMVLAFIWALMIVCSDDVFVYADWDCQEVTQLSSVILDGTELWGESNTDFVLQDSSTIRNRMRNSNPHSRMKVVQSAFVAQRCSLQFIQHGKYNVFLEIDEFSNEKIIMNYLHRQDGDK